MNKKNYYITFDPVKLIIWGCGDSEQSSLEDAIFQSTDQGCKNIKKRTIKCSEGFYREVASEGHYEDKLWAIVNGEPTFIDEDTFIKGLSSLNFKAKTFTIERPI
jgi:hypothetical protein